MSSVLGIDLSTFNVDLVTLDDNPVGVITHHRCVLKGDTALARLRYIPRAMPRWTDDFYRDVYLAAIEAPFSRGQTGSLAKLSRVLGAITVCLPPRLELWEVRQDEWRTHIGVKGNAPKAECAARCVELGAPTGLLQDTYDAWAVALYARDTNATAHKEIHA